MMMMPLTPSLIGFPSFYPCSSSHLVPSPYLHSAHPLSMLHLFVVGTPSTNIPSPLPFYAISNGLWLMLSLYLWSSTWNLPTYSVTRPTATVEESLYSYLAHTPPHIQVGTDIAEVDVRVLWHFISNNEVFDSINSWISDTKNTRSHVSLYRKNVDIYCHMKLHFDWLNFLLLLL